MKILIISLPRTGSSNLLFDIAKEKNLKPIFEPFSELKKNDNINRTYDASEDDIIVKTIINQHNNNIELAKEFDEVILLSRKDLRACAESFAYFVKNKSKGFGSWFPYVYGGITSDEIELALKQIISYHFKLQDISEKLNVPIRYYEDIYDVLSSERLRKFDIKEISKKIL
jgi:hypothetical protein